MANKRIYDLTEDTAPASGDYIVTDKSGEGAASKVNLSKLLLASGTIAGATSQAQTFTNGIIGPSWKPASDSTTALQAQDAAGTAVMTIDTTNQRVGLGTTAPENLLHLYQSLNNPIQTEEARFEQLYAITATDTDYIKALEIKKYKYNIPDAIISNGYQIGLASQIFVSDTNFAGTIADQRAIWARSGIVVAGAAGPRRIIDAYGLYVEGLSSAGTITNHYGIYQTGPGTKNYFGGNVGIGTTAPGARTHSVAAAAGTIALIAQAAASATANITEARDSAAAVQHAIGPTGQIKTNQAAANTNTPAGATAHQLPIYDAAGTLLGYIPVYGAAW